jgi:hypothetical protein
MNITRQFTLIHQEFQALTDNVKQYNNNNQAIYSQASWGRLEMKPHEQKKRVQNKSEK